MKSQVVLSAIALPLMMLSVAGCSRIFDSASVPDAQTNTPVDANGTDDAQATGCPLLPCDDDVAALFRFSSTDPLRNECGGVPLTNTGSTSVSESSSTPLGTALRIQSEQTLAAEIDVDGSWSLDFWFYPQAADGELLSVKRVALDPVVDCGLEMDMENGLLRFYWNTGVSRTLRGSEELTLNEWHLVTVVYIQTGNSATFRYFVDGQSFPDGSINQCIGGTPTLTLANWDLAPSASAGGVEGFLDEVRVRNISVTAPECSPPFDL